MVPEGGYAFGVIVKSDMGRPIKIEGNPGHTASLGAADAPIQASILTLYDPDRVRTLTNLGDIRPWSAFLAMMRGALARSQFH